MQHHPPPRSFFFILVFSNIPNTRHWQCVHCSTTYFFTPLLSSSKSFPCSRFSTQSHYHLPLSLALSDLSRVQIPNPSFHHIPSLFFYCFMGARYVHPTFCYHMTPAMLLSFLVLYLLSSPTLERYHILVTPLPRVPNMMMLL